MSLKCNAKIASENCSSFAKNISFLRTGPRYFMLRYIFMEKNEPL